MSFFEVHGGNSLTGEVKVHGAKNSVLPILAATIINAGKSVINNCPYISDVMVSIEILRHLGCTVEYHDESLYVDSSQMTRYDVPEDLMRKMRSSVIFLGAIIARTGMARMSFPGGCELGPRPIDMHISALKKLGAKITENSGDIFCSECKLSGGNIILHSPSVGATENVMISAATACGHTTIVNAAKEPEIIDLQNFLNSMGAKISGGGSSVVEIEGVNKLHGTVHSVIYDRIEAQTYMCAVAACRGDVMIYNAAHSHSMINILKEAGCDILEYKDGIRVISNKPLCAISHPIKTYPYPGFPTDAQSPLMATLTQAQGSSIFVENIFLNRYRHVDELIRMGADIKVENSVAIVRGKTKLFGASVECTDLRGGAAMLIAALCAQGRSTISHLEHLDRGYYDLENTIRSIGGKIQRLENYEKKKYDS